MTYFPLPDEFYADPKFTGASDAAIVLWARAASWSAHHLTDGLVPSTTLPLLHRDAEAAAAELVERRAWKRARGGFQFVGWPTLASRTYVEAKREGNRARQQKHRSSQHVLSRRDKRVTNTVTDGVTNGVSHSTQSNPIQISPHGDIPPSRVPPRKRGPTKRGTRLSDDFAVTAAMVAWARDRVPAVDGRLETEKFINYWRSKTGKDATKLDWEATWRNWMLNAAERARNRPANGHKPNADDTIAELLGFDRVPTQRLALRGAIP